MADKAKNISKNPKPTGRSPEGKSRKILQGFLAVMLALVVVAMVFCGVFYIILKNNVYGLGEAFRPVFQNNPILKLALPPLPGEFDPDAPENLTDAEIRKKYAEYRQKVAELTARLDEANELIGQYESDQSVLEENRVVLEANEKLLASIEKEQEKLEQQKLEVTELIASGNKEGFLEYFAQIDPETAEAIYKELAREDINRQVKAELAKPYAAMDPASAARVLAELWSKDQETAIGVFEGLNANAKAQILEKMEASLAAEITKTLSDRMLIK
ncbi:MAG: hypothetical protein GX027_01170 [Clostridiaceae bacterium]|jgi:flagellar motility protein MotE (MotC chaperone)|nr:hypothetical protein [Clostridiaceae bacterium]